MIYKLYFIDYQIHKNSKIAYFVYQLKSAYLFVILAILSSLLFIQLMNYKFIKDPRSRMASIGNSVFQKYEQASDNNDYQQIPTYSGYSKRKKLDHLQNYQYQLYGTQKNRIKTVPVSIQDEFQDITNPSIIYSRKEFEKKNSETAQLKKQIGELKSMLNQITKPTLTPNNNMLKNSNHYDQLFIQKKIMELLPRYSVNNPNNLNNLQIPPNYSYNHQPYNYQQPLSNPNYSGYNLPPNNSRYISDFNNLTNNQSPQYKTIDYPQKTTFKPKIKNKKNPRKRLKKIIFAVLFPIVLRQYSKRLRKIRKSIFDNTIDDKFEEATIGIKDWFMQGAKKILGVLIEKTELDLNFLNQKNPKLQYEKLKLNSELIMMMFKDLQQQATEQTLENFIEFLDFTSHNAAFVPEGILTNLQSKRLSYSLNSFTLQATTSVQQAQILTFVFIKVIVFNIFLQPWKIDERFKNKNLLNNLTIIGSIIYYLTVEIVQKKFRQKQPKYFNRGNISTKIIPQILQIENTAFQQNTYISGISEKKKFNPLINFDRGQFWRKATNSLQKLCKIIHKKMAKQHKKTIEQVKKKEQLEYQSR